jgi:hypothetical protein
MIPFKLCNKYSLPSDSFCRASGVVSSFVWSRSSNQLLRKLFAPFHSFKSFNFAMYGSIERKRHACTICGKTCYGTFPLVPFSYIAALYCRTLRWDGGCLPRQASSSHQMPASVSHESPTEFCAPTIARLRT